jgi:hypothetical protein
MVDETRVVRPDRFQTRWDFIDLEALLNDDHRARIVRLSRALICRRSTLRSSRGKGMLVVRLPIQRF